MDLHSLTTILIYILKYKCYWFPEPLSLVRLIRSLTTNSSLLFILVMLTHRLFQISLKNWMQLDACCSTHKYPSTSARGIIFSQLSEIHQWPLRRQYLAAKLTTNVCILYRYSKKKKQTSQNCFLMWFGKVMVWKLWNDFILLLEESKVTH